MRSRAAAMSSKAIGHTERRSSSSTSGIIGRVEVNVNGARTVVRDLYSPRLAAHLAVLNVLLRGAAPRVDANLVLFSAVWAHDMGHRIGGPVAEREVFDRVVAIPVHGSRCNPRPLAEELQSGNRIFETEVAWNTRRSPIATVWFGPCVKTAPTTHGRSRRTCHRELRGFGSRVSWRSGACGTTRTTGGA